MDSTNCYSSKKGGCYSEKFCEAKVVLIPKGNPKDIKDPLMARPIALLNCWYKIIDGVLNKKIQKAVDPKISKRQSAFRKKCIYPRSGVHAEMSNGHLTRLEHKESV